MTVDNRFELQKIAQYFPPARSVKIKVIEIYLICIFDNFYRIYRLVLRIRYEAEASFLGMKFGCDIDTEARSLIELSKSIGLNVGVRLMFGCINY